MTSQKFIFMPGEWLGEGKVEVSIPSEPLKFFSHWVVEEEKDGIILVQQDVEMPGFAEPMKNKMTFSNINNGAFSVILENPVFGIIEGKGFFDKESISWEFTQGSDSSIEGFELFKNTEEGYEMRAEYVSDEQLRTIVSGKLWEKKK